MSPEQGKFRLKTFSKIRDTFAGVLLAKLVGGSTIDEAVDMAQKAAVMTLASPHAVSKQIRKLKL